MSPLFFGLQRPTGFFMLVAILLSAISAPALACDADEMLVQMQSSCIEMVGGYQKALGKQLSSAAAQASLAQARAHCQALEFDKAGVKLALATQSMKPQP